MLQTRTIYPSTLELLKKLMQQEFLSDFNLVGGTALALQLGHRISVDLDLFTPNSFNPTELRLKLASLGTVDVTLEKPDNTLLIKLDGIKCDFIKYPFPLIRPLLEEEGIRLYSVEDIAAMKLTAIGGRGSKKDFWDLYFMLEKYSVMQIVTFFQEKFPNVSPFHILKSLTYFDDADIQNDPIMIQKVSWSKVKKVVAQKINAFMRN